MADSPKIEKERLVGQGLPCCVDVIPIMESYEKRINAKLDEQRENILCLYRQMHGLGKEVEKLEQ